MTETGRIWCGMSKITIRKIDDEVMGRKKIAIAGHIRPDGDCVGSCTALYLYLKQNKEEFGIEEVDVYLEPFGNEFRVLKGTEEIKHSYESDTEYDLFISLDCGSLDRLGNAQKYFQSAGKTINIDHHISNSFFAQVNHVVDDASSSCEVLYDLFEEEKITREVAECLYVGLIHDTGVYKHSNTSPKTLKVAGCLINRGVPFSKLIDETFYARTFMQTQLLGRCLMESRLILDGRVIVSSVDHNILELYQAGHADLDGVIDQLRVTKGTEAAIFLYEAKPGEYKVSLRSNGDLNVSKIALHFGGGGHIKAAGCTMQGPVEEIVARLAEEIKAQLSEEN